MLFDLECSDLGAMHSCQDSHRIVGLTLLYTVRAHTLYVRCTRSDDDNAPTTLRQRSDYAPTKLRRRLDDAPSAREDWRLIVFHLLRSASSVSTTRTSIRCEKHDGQALCRTFGCDAAGARGTQRSSCWFLRWIDPIQ